MTLHEIPEPELLQPPQVDIDDYYNALGKIKATVSQKDLDKHEDFTRDFGMEG